MEKDSSLKQDYVGDNEGDNDESESICRYCFGGVEDGPLEKDICNCKGGQKFVHLTCLRRWQRMVLVSQPTHPAYWTDDTRHHM